MDVKITPRITRNGEKIQYTFEWGKGTGQRVASGIFTFVHPANIVQRQYNKEALRLLEVKRCQLLLDQQAIGSGALPRMRFKANFLDFYGEYVHHNRQRGNRHLEASFTQFKIFIRKKYLPPIEVTEALSARFRGYLLDKFNGDTPANYFSRYKNVINAATKQGYFKYDPATDLPALSNSNHLRKEHLESEEYITLLKAPCTNEEVREAFILSCYTGMRWCDVKALNWQQVKEDRMVLVVAQRKTKVENTITLHPVAKAILDKRRGRIVRDAADECIFRLPSQDGALKCLDTWIRRAGIDKHITWNSARLSFSILLQDAKVDTATVALLVGHTSTKYVLNTYKRFRPKDPWEVILKLPVDN